MYFEVLLGTLLLGTLKYVWVLWGNVNSINLLFAWQVGKAQLIVGGGFVVVTSEQVIPFQHVSRVC